MNVYKKYPWHNMNFLKKTTFPKKNKKVHVSIFQSYSIFVNIPFKKWNY